MNNYFDIPDDYYFEMANLPPDRTGLPRVIWIDSLGKDRNNKHNKHNCPRLKVQNIPGNKIVPGDNFTIEISKKPKVIRGEVKISYKELNSILDYISDNYDLFIKHWNRELNDDDLKEKLAERECYILKK